MCPWLSHLFNKVVSYLDVENYFHVQSQISLGQTKFAISSSCDCSTILKVRHENGQLSDCFWVKALFLFFSLLYMVHLYKCSKDAGKWELHLCMSSDGILICIFLCFLNVPVGR